jgi:DNA-3-methyladenine glycosylase
LELDKSFYGEDLAVSSRIWVEDGEKPTKIITSPRIGIDYAGKPWTTHHWRFLTET